MNLEFSLEKKNVFFFLSLINCSYPAVCMFFGLVTGPSLRMSAQQSNSFFSEFAIYCNQLKKPISTTLEFNPTYNGQFQKISIPNHGRLPCFNPPLPSEIPKCVTPPCPQNSIIVNPPSPSEFPVFLGSTFSILATPI